MTLQFQRTRRGEFGEFSLVLPKKPDSESENEPYILKPSTRRPRTVRINSRNPNSRVASIRQTRNRVSEIILSIIGT